MKIKRMDATISTEKLQESKKFYQKYFGFRLVYESDWYVELLSPDINGGISFALAEREESEFFDGRGLIISFEVENAAAEYTRLKQAGLCIQQEMQDKPWGERGFVVDDPNGVHLYLYQTIPPTLEYKKIYDSFQQQTK
ncbi:MAG: VOC family protein [Veillonellales bacterium]